MLSNTLYFTWGAGGTMRAPCVYRYSNTSRALKDYMQDIGSSTFGLPNTKNIMGSAKLVASSPHRAVAQQVISSKLRPYIRWDKSTFRRPEAP